MNRLAYHEVPHHYGGLALWCRVQEPTSLLNSRASWIGPGAFAI